MDKMVTRALVFGQRRKKNSIWCWWLRKKLNWCIINDVIKKKKRERPIIEGNQMTWFPFLCTFLFLLFDLSVMKNVLMWAFLPNDSFCSDLTMKKKGQIPLFRFYQKLSSSIETWWDEGKSPARHVFCDQKAWRYSPFTLMDSCRVALTSPVLHTMNNDMAPGMKRKCITVCFEKRHNFLDHLLGMPLYNLYQSPKQRSEPT